FPPFAAAHAPGPPEGQSYTQSAPGSPGTLRPRWSVSHRMSRSQIFVDNNMGAGWRALCIRRAPLFDVSLQVSERTDRMAMEGEGHVDSLDHRDRLCCWCFS